MAPSIQQRLQRSEPLVCTTAYDQRIAQLIDRTGDFDLILVGDSVANTKLGYADTRELTLAELLHHVRAVRRGVSETLIAADLPWGSYEQSLSQGLASAYELVRAGAELVKLEGGAPYIVELAAALTERGIPVIGHLGYLPQQAAALGLGRRQGVEPKQAATLTKQAQALAAAGCVALVLELIPPALAAELTSTLPVPTIGIGAGAACRGQILVSDDLLGLSERQFSFVRRYAELGSVVNQALTEFAREVRAGEFPSQD